MTKFSFYSLYLPILGLVLGQQTQAMEQAGPYQYRGQGVRDLHQMDLFPGGQGDIYSGLKNKRNPRLKLCGDQLIQMLSLVCGSFFPLSPNGMAGYADIFENLKLFEIENRRKKSSFEKRGVFNDNVFEGFVDINRDQLANYVGKRQTGLAETCCRNACSLGQLRAACV